MKIVSHAMLPLALLGLGVAFYDSYAIYNGQALWCHLPSMGAMKSPAVHTREYLVCRWDILALSTTCTCSAYLYCSFSIHFRQHYDLPP